MNMKNGFILILVMMLSAMSIACSKVDDIKKDILPQVSQMRAISELAVMECYYHNVAKYLEEDAGGFLSWKKDKRFWIEYSGTVKVGIDASLVNLEISGDVVKISIPKAKVLNEGNIGETNLNEMSYIVAKNSVDIKAEDEKEALKVAQAQMVKIASEDKVLLESAQQRAKMLLENYVKNIGDAVGKEYVVEFKISDEQ